MTTPRLATPGRGGHDPITRKLKRDGSLSGVAPLSPRTPPPSTAQPPVSAPTHSDEHSDLDGPRPLVRRRAGRFGSFVIRRPVSPRLVDAPENPVYDVAPTGDLRARENLVRRMLAVGDAIAGVAAVVVVFGWATEKLGGPQALLFVPLIVAIHKIAGLYDRDDLVLRRSTLDEMPALLQVSSVYTLIVAAVGEPLFGTRLGPQQYVVLWVVATLLITGSRIGTRWIARLKAPDERCLVVGDADRIEHVCEKLDHVGRGANVVAAIGVRRGEGAIPGVDDLRALIKHHDIHRVVIAPLSHDTADIVDLVRTAKAAGVRVSILPRVLEAVGSSVEFEQLDGMTMLGVRRFGLSRSSLLVKRCFDLVIGTISFVAVLPLFLVLCLAVRLDSHGPVFFRQVRIGRDGRPFRIWKFRSMVTDAEAMKKELEALNEAGPGMFKVADDPRVTRVGRFLRKTSLDELPQILNVLSGEMSLVGPRPLIIDEDALVQGLYRARLHLTPGMTGPWQILGSTRVPMDEMVGIDYLYVANWSLWEDVKLLLRTVPHMVARRGM